MTINRFNSLIFIQTIVQSGLFDNVQNSQTIINIWWSDFLHNYYAIIESGVYLAFKRKAALSLRLCGLAIKWLGGFFFVVK